MYILVQFFLGYIKKNLTSVISMLGEPKYGPGYEPHWKAGSARYPVFYKSLLDETSRTDRDDMVRARGNSSSTRNQ